MIEDAVHFICDRCRKEDYIPKKTYTDWNLALFGVSDKFNRTYYPNNFIKYGINEGKVLCKECSEIYEKILEAEENFWESE